MALLSDKASKMVPTVGEKLGHMLRSLLSKCGRADAGSSLPTGRCLYAPVVEAGSQDPSTAHDQREETPGTKKFT